MSISSVSKQFTSSIKSFAIISYYIRFVLCCCIGLH